MTKQEAIDLLHGVQASVVYGYAIHQVGMKETEQLRGQIRSKKIGLESSAVGTIALELDGVYDSLGRADDKRAIFGNFVLLLRHQLIRTAFEIAAAYAYDSKQQAKFWESNVIRFARVVRNVLSHRDYYTLHRWPDAWKGKVPSVTWRKRTITEADVGQPLALDPAETFLLHSDIIDVVKNDLV